MLTMSFKRTLGDAYHLRINYWNWIFRFLKTFKLRMTLQKLGYSMKMLNGHDLVIVEVQNFMAFIAPFCNTKNGEMVVRSNFTWSKL